MTNTVCPKQMNKLETGIPNSTYDDGEKISKQSNMDKSKERTEDKMNINEVYLDNLKDDDMDQTSKVSTKEKSKSKNDILESNIGLPCNNSNQTEPSNLLSDSEEIEIVGVHKTKDLMDKDDYKFQEKKGHNINLLK